MTRLTVNYKEHYIHIGGDPEFSYQSLNGAFRGISNTLIGAKRAISKHIIEQSQVRAEMYDFGHDYCGNPTSHFTIWHQGKVLFRTKRRQQCGYGSDRADGALVSARAYVGNHLKLKSYEGRRSDREISAIFQ